MILHQSACNVSARFGAHQGTVEGHIWTFPLQVTVDSQETLFPHLFSSAVHQRLICEIAGAVKPVHISVWVDMAECAGGTVTGHNTCIDPTTL